MSVGWIAIVSVATCMGALAVVISFAAGRVVRAIARVGCEVVARLDALEDEEFTPERARQLRAEAVADYSEARCVGGRYGWPEAYRELASEYESRLQFTEWKLRLADKESLRGEVSDRRVDSK